MSTLIPILYLYFTGQVQLPIWVIILSVIGAIINSIWKLAWDEARDDKLKRELIKMHDNFAEIIMTSMFSRRNH